MLLLHEVHTVAGKHEDEFEAAFRDGWMPNVATDDDARLLYFLRLAHGTGRAYHTVTITALRDGAAYERLATRVQRGDLRSWAADLDLLRHEVSGKLLLPVDWSPMADLDLATVPTDGREHDAVLYMEDSAWPHEASLDLYLEKARTHYAPSLEERTARSLLTLLGVFQAALGAVRRREVVLWQRVDFPERLPALVHTRAPRAREGPGHLDARRARSARRLGEPVAAQSALVAARLTFDQPAASRVAGLGEITLRRSSAAAIPPSATITPHGRVPPDVSRPCTATAVTISWGTPEAAVPVADNTLRSSTASAGTVIRARTTPFASAIARAGASRVPLRPIVTGSPADQPVDVTAIAAPRFGVASLTVSRPTPLAAPAVTNKNTPIAGATTKRARRRMPPSSDPARKY